ncbi:MAG: hypothetical protein J0L97_03690 [Alphaproteobacteria bacterium]|nr:hypothetical protein [Alphaproteobacteria bacterium]
MQNIKPVFLLCVILLDSLFMSRANAEIAEEVACPTSGKYKESIIEITCDEEKGHFETLSHLAYAPLNTPLEERKKGFSLRFNGKDVPERKLSRTCHIGEFLHVVIDIDLNRDVKYLEYQHRGLDTSAWMTSAADLFLFINTDKIAEIIDVLFYSPAVEINSKTPSYCKRGKRTSYLIGSLIPSFLQVRPSASAID